MVGGPARSGRVLWEAGKGGQTGGWELPEFDPLLGIVRVRGPHTTVDSLTLKSVAEVTAEAGTLGDRA